MSLRTLLILVLGALTLWPTLVWAKKVRIDWDLIPGAIQYELRIDRGNDRHTTERTDDSQWSGELPFGAYTYQLRAIDRLKQPGEWTESRQLVVMSPSPEPTEPKSGAVLRHYNPKHKTTLQWQGIKNITQYQIELKKDQKVYYTRDVSGTKIELDDLPPGKYQWTIKSVIEGRKKWMSASGDDQEFTIEHPTLAQPTLTYPLQVLPPPRSGKLQFKWNKVDGAESYEIRLVKIKKGDAQRAIASEMKKAEAFLTRETSIELPTAGEGNYRWQVRALAGVAGPEASSTFALDPKAMFLEGSGYIAFSTMFAPYFYEMRNQQGRGRADSDALTGRISGEYWLRAHLGVAAGAELTYFSLNGQEYWRKTFELTGKYRASMSNNIYGWFIAPKLGVEAREFQVIYQSTALAPVMALGGAVGVDIRKQFNDRWSLGAKVSYFVPLTLMVDGGGQIVGNESYRNISIGVQALYWLKANWGISAGAYIEQRSIGYAPSGSTGTFVTMDGQYFFGSLIYSFGR